MARRASGGPPDPWTPRLRSSVPGRERWEVEALRHRPDRVRELEAALAGEPGILEVRGNPVTGRLLVRYAPGAPRPVAILRSHLRELSRRPAGPPAPPARPALSRLLAE